MNEVVSVQLAISRLHMKAMAQRPLSQATLVEALAELNTALSFLESAVGELSVSRGMIANLTESYSAEVQRCREVFEHLPVACMVTDEWGVIETANPAAAINVERDMLIGKPISVLVPPEDRRALRDRLQHIPRSGVLDAAFQLRGGSRISVQLDVLATESPSNRKQHRWWFIRNTTAERTAASTEKMLTREVTLRLEAQAAVTRLRALHVGLERLAQGENVGVPQRVGAFLESLVPRFANCLRCELPGDLHAALEVGSPERADHYIEARIEVPLHTPGRLIAWRRTPFGAEDRAILTAAANAITALMCSMYNARSPEAA